MRLTVEHVTRYAYSQPQRRLIQLLRATPTSFAAQHVVAWRVGVDRDARIRTGRDGFGNITTMLYVDGPVDAITLTAGGEVLTDDRAGVVEDAPEPLPPALFLRASPLTRPDEAMRVFARRAAADARDPLERMHLIMARLLETIRYVPTLDAVERDAASAFHASSGVCQDHAHIFCAIARETGIPARYVSGHLFRRDGLELQEASHAWAEACIPDLGWVGFDPANGISPDDAYIRVACGLDYRDAAPGAGRRVGGGEERLKVDVRVAQARSQAQS
ncbi:MAG: transglutaminase family protein [Sphingomonadaceae bacterium]|nr:transglutaminase family protein [Sphingomonadaceae bacterium]